MSRGPRVGGFPRWCDVCAQVVARKGDVGCKGGRACTGYWLATSTGDRLKALQAAEAAGAEPGVWPPVRVRRKKPRDRFGRLVKPE